MSGEPPRPGADLKAAVEALRRRTQQYRLLAEQAADGVLLVAPDGRIADANDSACALFAWPRAEILRKRVRDLFADEADRDREWDALLHLAGTQKRATRWNAYLVDRLGGLEPPEVVAVPLRVGGQVRVVLYGDNMPEGRPIGPVDALEFMVLEAAAALERAAARGAEGGRRES